VGQDEHRCLQRRPQQHFHHGATGINFMKLRFGRKVTDKFTSCTYVIMDKIADSII
jgi:hypothetical protein